MYIYIYACNKTFKVESMHVCIYIYVQAVDLDPITATISIIIAPFKMNTYMQKQTIFWYSFFLYTAQDISCIYA